MLCIHREPAQPPSRNLLRPLQQHPPQPPRPHRHRRVLGAWSLLPLLVRYTCILTVCTCYVHVHVALQCGLLLHSLDINWNVDFLNVCQPNVLGILEEGEVTSSISGGPKLRNTVTNAERMLRNFEEWHVHVYIHYTCISYMNIEFELRYTCTCTYMYIYCS